MKNRTEKEITEFVESVWDDASKVSVFIRDDGVVAIEVSAMYEAPSLNFDRLIKLSEFMETKNINDDDRYHYSGCETCDYGSEAGYTLTVREE